MANIYKNEMFTLANTGSNLMYTVPVDSRTIVKTIQVQSNVSNATITLSAHTSGNVATTVGTQIVAVNTTENLLKGPLILEESEFLTIVANTANTASGIVSVLEINRNEQ